MTLYHLTFMAGTFFGMIVGATLGAIAMGGFAPPRRPRK